MSQPQWNQPPTQTQGFQADPSPQQQWSANDPYGTYGAHQGMAPYQPPPSYGYGMGQVDHPQATTVFVLGLLSVLGFTVLGPFAWYTGTKARAEVRRNPERYRSGGLLTAGWVMGIVGTALLALFVLYVVAMIVFAFGMTVR